MSEGTEGRKFAESRLSKGDTDKLGNYLRQLNYSVGDMSDEIRKVPDRLSEMLERKRNNETRKSSITIGFSDNNDLETVLRLLCGDEFVNSL